MEKYTYGVIITVTFSLVLIAYFIKLAIDKFGDVHEKP